MHLSETCSGEKRPRVITHVDTTTADVHEARCTSGIHETLSRKGLAPSVHLTDSAYIYAGHLVRAREEHSIRMVGPTRKDPSWQARANRKDGEAVAYTTDQFTVDWASDLNPEN